MTCKRIGYSFIGVWLLVLGIFLIPAVCRGASQKTDGWKQVEKAVTSPETKGVRCHYGKINSLKNAAWKKSLKVSLSAENVRFSKKGWYTFRIMKNDGTAKLLYVRIKKKQYAVAGNRCIRQKEQYGLLRVRAAEEKVLGIKGDSCLESSGAVFRKESVKPACIWHVEPAGGKRFRLKNENSGLYLTVQDGTAVQKKYDKNDKNMIFQAIARETGDFLLRCTGTKQYLSLKGSRLICAERKKTKEAEFFIEKKSRPESDIQAYEYTAPTLIEQGSAFVLKGTVTSAYAMASLTAAVEDEEGKAVLKKTVTPAGGTYELSQIDEAITFGRLAVGKYTYRVTVKDTRGTQKVVIEASFAVQVTVMEASKILSYDKKLIEKIGYQVNGTALEKKACASYALAYCHAILHNETADPHSYWLDADTVDCVWSRGGFTTFSYGSEQAVLQAAYRQLTAGRPCILHVTGTTSSQHWLTLIGYEKAEKESSLTLSAFTAIDPWDGSVIRVSDKYKVKNTYRLAYVQD